MGSYTQWQQCSVGHSLDRDVTQGHVAGQP